ncbi:hypothetical protein [Scytonema hofmannii]|uniref:hypothetical protein n=1 Tax=Scytonema hofmannii TaxID=34078 RepID=UPI0011DF4429|nr:hypothetical protein [Scytonema hofmannii]
MIGFQCRQQLPLIFLHGHQPVRELSNSLVSLEPISTKPVATSDAVVRRLVPLISTTGFFINSLPSMLVGKSRKAW